jgi:hypothetical protein
MRSNRETIYQRDPAWAIRNGAITNPARNFSTPGLESYARDVGCSTACSMGVCLCGSRSQGFQHLPPWAHPAWVL